MINILTTTRTIVTQVQKHRNLQIPYVYAAFPMFLTVANATFLLRKRKKSDGNLLDSPLILAGWEKNLRFRMLLRNKMLCNTFITLLRFGGAKFASIICPFFTPQFSAARLLSPRVTDYLDNARFR